MALQAFALANQLVAHLNLLHWKLLAQSPSPSASPLPNPASLDFWRDGIWQSVGGLLGILSIVITIAIAWRQSQKKAFTYKILSKQNIVQVADTSVGNDLQILYKNVTIKNLYLIVVEFTNSGNVAIRKEDFSGSLYIKFNEPAFVLGHSVLKKKPENLRLEIELPLIPDTLEIYPLLLNKKDSFILQFFVTGYNGITIDGRVAEVGEIKEIQSEALSRRETQFADNLSNICAVAGCCMAVLVVASTAGSLAGVMSLVGIVLFGLLVPFIINKII